MRNLTIKKQITACDLTPEQWGLYDDNDFDTARELNRAVVIAFNSDKPGHKKWKSSTPLCVRIVTLVQQIPKHTTW